MFFLYKYLIEFTSDNFLIIFSRLSKLLAYNFPQQSLMICILLYQFSCPLFPIRFCLFESSHLFSWLVQPKVCHFCFFCVFVLRMTSVNLFDHFPIFYFIYLCPNLCFFLPWLNFGLLCSLLVLCCVILGCLFEIFLYSLSMYLSLKISLL